MTETMLDSGTYRETRAAWERIWGEETDFSLELQTVDYARSKHVRSLYLPYLSPTHPILEAGCGLGVELIGLSRQGLSAIGLDYATNALLELHDRQPRFRLVGGDIHRLPFPDGAFGAYLSFGVLEHFEFGPEPALREASRVLRPDGVLVLTVPYPNFVWRWARLRTASTGRAPAPGPRYFETAYSLRRLEGHLRAAGFAVTARHPVGHSFALWGLGGPFRDPGYYQTSFLAERLGSLMERVFAWPMCHATLVIGRKTAA